MMISRLFLILTALTALLLLPFPGDAAEGEGKYTLLELMSPG